MTAITEPAGRGPALDRLKERIRSTAFARTSEPAWVLLALLGVTALAAVLYIWNLTVSGYANQYYSAAALAASKSWSAWFFGSFDASNFITVDKPPLNTMVMGLSVRLFGLSSWSILLPEAIAGVATVVMLFVAVRKTFGPVPATLAALLLAITPAAVLIFRFNNPDALLTLLLVTSAYALLRAVDHGSLRWMALAATLVGLAFLTKYLQAFLVLPGYALVWGFSADTSLRRRLIGLPVALATVLLVSGWWVVIVELIPLGTRPFIGGSTTGSPLDLIFGYDGLGRIFGGGGPGPGGGGGGGFGGAAGLLRLFNDQWFGQVSWFIPLAIVGLVAGLAMRFNAPRTDRGLAGYLLWGTWFVTTAVVFSYMDGIVHTYYAVALAPAVAVLAAAGLVDLWRLHAGRFWLGGLAVGGALLGTAWFGLVQLQRTPAFMPQLGSVAVAAAGAVLLVLALASVPGLRDRLRRLALMAAAFGLVAAIAAPAAYAIDTTGQAYGGGDPHPGPGAAGGLGAGGFGPGGFGPGGALPAGPGTQVPGGNPPGGPGGIGPGGVGPGASGPGGIGAPDQSANGAMLQYLIANRGSARWIVAANGANQAGPIELATGEPVMAMGGFTGQDPSPTLGQLRSYIRSGELRFVLAAGGFGGFRGGSEDLSWVESACKQVSINGSTSSLYDCQGAA